MIVWTVFENFLQSILLWLGNLTGSLGLGIVLFTILTRVILLPLTIKQLQSSKKMQELQPMIQELRRKYGKDQQKFAQEMSKLYKEHKANPAGGCLPLVIQLPIFIGVYRAVFAIANSNEIAGISRSFLWMPNLSQHDPYYILPVLSVVLQLLVSVMAMPKIQDPQQKVMSQTMLLMPLFFGYIAFRFNAGAVLYWVTGSLLAVVQQYFVSGWGSLSNYLTFLPERKGYLTPATPVAVATTTTVSAGDEDEPQGSSFWAPLAKLQTQSSAGDSTIDDGVGAKGKKQR